MTDKTAKAFTDARKQARALPDYPGTLPVTMAEAYAIQDAAIGLWPDSVVGWKVGLVPPQYRKAMGAERLVGPVFASDVAEAAGGKAIMRVFDGGFGAVEAEFIVEVASDADPAKADYTPREAARLVARIRIGIEPAGSPFSGINDNGPAVTASDFGNNAGLILGPDVPDWRERTPESFGVETWIDGVKAGDGTAASVPGGPLSAFAFALGLLAQRGRPLKRGDLVTTGAATGIHQVTPGQSARVVFAGVGELSCEIVAAAPR